MHQRIGTKNRTYRGFTLIELMIVISIIAILAGLGFSAYSGATRLSREQRTGSQIKKIDQLISERYEGYRTRSVPIKIPVGTPSRVAAMMRLNALRDLMRMELPDRKSDVINPPCDCDPRSGSDPNTGVPYITVIAPPASPLPSLRSSYIRRGTAAVGATNWPVAWTEQYQAAECLYLILSTMRDGDKNALDYFDSTEIGDTDGDGMNEILDGWGVPIEFIRWPAGYIVDNIPDPATLVGPVASTQTKDYTVAPDPFDPVKVHAGPSGGPATLFGAASTPGYALYPLIYSAGPDKKLDVVTDLNSGSFFSYSPPSATGNNYPNPYVQLTVTLGSSSVTVPIGTPGDTDFDGVANYADNITNHSQRSQE